MLTPPPFPLPLQSKLYDSELASMDCLGGFVPEATSGFIEIESIRIKAWAKGNEPGAAREKVYGPRA